MQTERERDTEGRRETGEREIDGELSAIRQVWPLQWQNRGEYH